MSRVLVVESEPWLREHFERLLVKQNFTVVAVPHAYAAIDAIEHRQPDIIVMGLMLSGADGLVLLHELQSYVDTATIPVIICSDRAHELSLDELKPYGVVRLMDTGVMKPDDLPATVRSVLA